MLLRKKLTTSTRVGTKITGVTATRKYVMHAVDMETYLRFIYSVVLQMNLQIYPRITCQGTCLIQFFEMGLPEYLPHLSQI